MTHENEQNDVGPAAMNEAVDLVPDLLARRFAGDTRSYWEIVWAYFRGNGPAYVALWIMFGMATLAVFAPFLANHRPYFMMIGEGVLRASEKNILHPGLNLSLTRALGSNDWVLIGVYFQSLLALWTYRRAKRNKMVVSNMQAGMMLFVGLAPMLLALVCSPAIRAFLAGDETNRAALNKGLLWWIMVGGLGVVGLGGVLHHSARLLWQKRDQFGNIAPLGHIVWLIVGSFLTLFAAGEIGTLGAPVLDTTDYFKVAQRDGVRAVFPPVAHNYVASNSYMLNQRPLGPNTRVLSSGVSEVASDLGLTDTTRKKNLVASQTTGTGGDVLVPETRLDTLNFGDGVRFQEDTPGPDFTLVSHSFKAYPVYLKGAKTLAEVFVKVEEATAGNVLVRISDDGTRLDFDDRTTRRPRFWMGTGPGGSDVAARILHATRVALSIGFVSTTIALSIGIFMGALMGYFGGWVDIVGMRIIEIFMAIPRLFLLLTIIAVIPPEFNDYMLYAMMAVIGATSWMGAARFIRAEFFKLRDQDFVLSAKACGLPMRSILFKHMLPNGVTPVLVDASFGVAAAIFIETGLSFLGFGIKPPQPSWGQMLSSAVDPTSGSFSWWLAIFPGIMIFLTVFCFNLIGDALRDAIDPKLRKANAA